MKNDASNRVSGSGMTSPKMPSDEQSASLSEADFLKQEAGRAKAAIGRALTELGENLKATANPHQLTRDHPWVAVSSAAIAGFAAAVTMVPSKQQQALRALAQLERARSAPPPAPAATSDKAAAMGGIGGTVVAEALKMLRPLLTTLLSAGVGRVAGGGNGPPSDGNGHVVEPEISTPS
jgi:hypothetical protein